jgi:4-amino-4-deoxy-L-arabinose transferase-like glycosyltransferase
MEKLKILIRRDTTIKNIVESKYFIPFCFVLAFVIRLIWISIFDPTPVSDFSFYCEAGFNISQGNGYSIKGNPVIYRPIGYPLFLGVIFVVFGYSLLIPKLANIILYMGILIFSFLIARKQISEFVARVTLLVLSIYPNHIAYSSLLATEILFLFLIMFAFWLYIEGRNKTWLLVISGVIFGFACLIKPLAIFIPIIAFGVTFVTKNSKKNYKRELMLFMTVYFCLTLTVLPLMVRNYLIYGEVIFVSANGGINLFIGNNPQATGGWVNPSMLLDTTLDEIHRDQLAFSTAIEYIVMHPLETVLRIPAKLYYLFILDYEGISWNEAGIDPISVELKTSILLLKIIAQMVYILILGSFFFYFIKYQKLPKKVPKLGIGVILYFILISIIFFGSSRYHFSMIPWLVMCFGVIVEETCVFTHFRRVGYD